jgi:plastocyanin
MDHPPGILGAPMRSLRTNLALLAAAVALVACSSATARTTTQTNANGDVVIYAPEPSHGPFVVVAVDNHFHDIHPVDDPRIAESRPFVVKNEGRNLHNFTVVGTRISVDIPPGHELRWSRLGDHLRPGSYQVICTYHAYLGMVGDFVVTR